MNNLKSSGPPLPAFSDSAEAAVNPAELPAAHSGKPRRGKPKMRAAAPVTPETAAELLLALAKRRITRNAGLKSALAASISAVESGKSAEEAADPFTAIGKRLQARQDASLSALCGITLHFCKPSSYKTEAKTAETAAKSAESSNLTFWLI